MHDNWVERVVASNPLEREFTDMPVKISCLFHSFFDEFKLLLFKFVAKTAIFLNNFFNFKL